MVDQKAALKGKEQIPGNKMLVISGRVLVISHPKEQREQLVKIIEQQGYETKAAENYKTGARLCRRFQPDVVVIYTEDLLKFSYKTDNNFLGKVLSLTPTVLVIHPESSNLGKSNTIREGADEFLAWPVSHEELAHRIKAAVLSRRCEDETNTYITNQETALNTLRQHNASFYLELEEAGEVQRALNANQNLFIRGFGINSFIRAAQKLNGDYIDIFMLDRFRVAIILMDISGHGTGAAMITGMTHAWLHSTLHKHINLAEATEELHRYLLAFTPPAMYATGFIGILDTMNSNLEYVLAGHPEPLFWHNEVCQVGPQAVTPPLGLHNEFKAVISCCHIMPGEAMLVYSDGILDALANIPNAKGKLCSLYTRHNSDRLCLRNRKCCMAVDVLRIGHTPKDDMAVLCLTRFPEQMHFGDLTVSRTGKGHYKLNISSSENALGDLHAFLTNNLLEEIGEPLFWDILQVTMELARNAAEWGNGFDTSKTVNCLIRIADQAIILSVKDEGKGFDTISVMEKSHSLDPDRLLTDRRGGGCGLKIAMGLADRLFFNQSGNRVTARFTRNRS